ncbi:hypothetical protein N0V88_007795 [Collariella sp. IMI 366227]|nr:hypothetical protein N0V88_007795 [Collariella sp. IMI 366227]
MAHSTTLIGLLAVLIHVAKATVLANNATETCKEIDGKISKASDVLYPTCVVEVGSQEDVSLVLQAVAKSQTPFAIYSAGHASNPGFSSTTGIHISLKRFNQVKLSEDKTTVEVGFGQGWTDVYKALKDTGVNVVGGRVPGPGLGGFTLGGGYSWKTNQHGLTCDTVLSFNLILPNGTITTASAQHNEDLFFALRGGMNRFGIVTARVLLFYDGPEKPPIFDMFDGFFTVLDNTGSKSYRELIYSFPAYLATNIRAEDDWWVARINQALDTLKQVMLHG